MGVPPEWGRNLKLVELAPNGIRRPFAIDPARPLGEGGAGRVYAHPLERNHVIKVYKPDQVAAHADKVRAMLANPPDQQIHQHDSRSWVQIAWPRATVTDERGNFVGFSMPMVDFGASTEVDQLMQKVDRKAEKLPEAYQFRLYAARNLASLVTELHCRGHHVIDMKPQNMRVYRANGFIALIDCDGFSVRGEAARRFPAALYTPNYLCPEGFGRNASDLDEDQDRFALGVLIFQLLNNGVHPFQGRAKPGRGGEVPDEIPPRISQGLYAHSRGGNGPQGPHPMSLLGWQDDLTAEMYERAFGTGRLRPTAREWRDHLTAQLSALVQCPNSPDHQHFSKGCGLCALEARAGRRTAVVKPVQMPVPQPIPIRPTPRPTMVPQSVPPPPKPRRRIWVIAAVLTLSIAAAYAVMIGGKIDTSVERSPSPMSNNPAATENQPIRPRYTSEQVQSRPAPAPELPRRIEPTRSDERRAPSGPRQESEIGRLFR